MRVLIFMKSSDLRPAGGPAGFCYNIYQDVLKRNIDEITFLPAEKESVAKKVNIYRKVTKYVPVFVNQIQIALRRKKAYEKMIKAPSSHNLDLDGYDAVHFHSTISLYKHRKDLENYSGKVLLTTHSPVPQHQEIYAELPTEWEKRLYKEFYAGLDAIDRYAFQRADYVVFPCEDAEESYLRNWPEYKEIHEELAQRGKLIYIPTGIQPKPVLRNREQVCADHEIQPGKLLVSYAGRHNQVKGYDLLQEIAKRAWKRNNDFSFAICGKESPLRGLQDLRWKEIGWTNDSQSIIAASDVFVLPNRETYFDIIMLEVLSSGKLVVASKTGGNKFFEKIGAQGVFLYETVDEAVGILERLAEMSAQEKLRLEEANKKLFDEHFTTDKYVDKYLSVLNQALKN